MNTEHADELYSTSIELLKQLIAIPSFSKEEHGTALHLYNFLQSRKIQTHRLMNNVWACNKYYDEKKPTILLNSHHDTVKPNQSYTNNPFIPIEKEGMLFGLGSNDAGGCLVALITCFLYYYDKKDLNYNIVFAATAEEEISGVNGIEALLPHLSSIDWAIVGEPTNLEMAVSEKGLLVLDCVTKGISGHAARNEGDNAIYKCIKDIEWFRNYVFPEVSELLGAVKMTVTTIDAGTQHNVIPDVCRFTVDVRVNDCYTHEEILAVIKQHVDCEVMARSMRLKSTHISLDHPIVKAGIQIGKQAFGSSTLSDKALMPFPTLKMGPGNSARSHTADEFIYLHEIKEGITTYIQLLNAVL